jgi:hypothetical protein
VWKGATNIPIDGGSPRPLLSKFTVTVTDQADSPLSLTDAVSVGLPVNTGGILHVTGNTMVFKVRVEMFVSDDGGTTYVPHLDYYDAAPTPQEAISAYSSYTYGFYWENDPPELENKLTLNVNEGDTAIISSSVLKVTDVEGTPSDILFIVNPEKTDFSLQNGKLIKSNSDLAPGDTFTMEDINNGLITFIHNGGETTSDSISFMVVDGNGAKYRHGEDSIFYLIVNVTPVDDPPTVAVNEGMTVNEDETLPVSDLMLLTTDPESNDSSVTYTLDPLGNSDIPAHGLLKLNNLPLSDGATFTQADIHNGNLVYQHDGSETVLDGFVFQVADEFGHLANDNEHTVFLFEIRITPVNDLPVLVVNQNMTLNEGETMPLSDTILLSTDTESKDSAVIYTLDPAGDSDFPAHGLLKLNNVPLNDGDNFTQADIHNGKLIYQHDGSESVLDGFLFQVADGSGGLAKDNENEVFFFEIKITPVNDPPVLTQIRPIEVNQGTEVIISNLYLAVSDAESSPQDITFTLDPDQNVEQPISGTIKLNGTALTDGQTFTMADINDSLVSYANNGSADTTDFFAFTASDSDGSFVEDAGFTLFHFNFIIKLPSDLNNLTADPGDLFSMYPNPVRDRINIRFYKEAAGEVDLVLFNMMGENIWEVREKVSKEYSIPFSDYPAGVYYLKAGRNNEIQTVKFIKR